MTLRELAQQLGLSITTVSRALGGHGDVSAATRERVLAAAAELGYRPNPLGQRLRSGRTEAVGVVLPVPPDRMASPFFLELLAGLGERLTAAGLDLLVTACPPGPDELGRYRRLVEGRRVDGLVVVRTRRHDERIEYLLDRGIPFAAHGRAETSRPFAFLDADGERGFLEATRHLVALGHRRVALVNAPAEYNFSRHRLDGYQRALEEAGIRPDPRFVVEGDLTEEGGHAAARRLLALPAPPTALLCANDLTAFGAMHALRELGLRAGRDLSVVGYDDVPLARFGDPPLTTLRQPTRAMGGRLAELLLARLGGAAPEGLAEVWPAELVLRETHGPVAAPEGVSA